MHVAQASSLFILIAFALAAPQGNARRQVPDGTNGQPVMAVVGSTTPIHNGNFGAFGPAGSQPAAASETPNGSPTPVVSSPVTDTSSNSAVQSSSVGPTSTPVSDSNDSYMGIVSEWRSKMGLSALTEDSTLAANALKTAVDGKGEMKHELNPGSMAQVLAPGKPEDFENCFVGGWLCEIPTLPGLDGICDTMSAGWAYGGETGHADILSSTSYTKIGCGNAEGIWACDLA